MTSLIRSSRLVSAIAPLTVAACLLAVTTTARPGGTAAVQAADEKPDAAADQKANSKAVPEFDAEAVAFFQQKVKPLLEARCFECHAGTSKRLEGGLRLDARPFVLKGGDSGPAAVAGKPDESLLIEAVNYESFEMPPKGRLPAGEIAIFRKWIELGMPWSEDGLNVEVVEEEFPLEGRKREHWAWQPISFDKAPDVKDATWPTDDFDRFILAKLEENALKPNPDADRSALIRRAYFTLIGLPPEPERVEAFINDPASDAEALTRLIDELLESPHFGERWARHWLDLVRYAETLGHEFDYPLHNAYKYRDYVIRAFNADVPYDQFVREHLAGDLLPNPRRNPETGTNESILGTGFWFLSELKHAPVDVKGEEASVIDNQIDVFSKTFLALTVSCTRCHDHKFDAITSRDYYALAGFLQSSHRQNAYLDPQGRIAETVGQLKQQYEHADQLLKQQFSAGNASHTERLATFLTASREVLFGKPTPEEASAAANSQRPDILFADFESESFAPWQAEGDAFKTGPDNGAFPAQRLAGVAGQRFANSFAGNDNLTGQVTSPEFEVSRKQISFLIAGGKWPGDTCLNLLIDGKVERTATGSNSDRLEAASWDVSEFAGHKGVLQIVDQRTGGWGHIDVDQIVFTDQAESSPYRRPIEGVAQQFGLDASDLRRWVGALLDDNVDKPSNPLSSWRQLASVDSGQLDATARRLGDRLRGEQQRLDDFRSQTDRVDDFDGAPFGPASSNSGSEANSAAATDAIWRETGWAFDDGPIRGTGWNPAGAPHIDGSISSARYGRKLRGVLRSPTFTLTKPNLIYRIAGSGVTVRLIVDGYRMDEFSGLLFGGCRFDVNDEQPHWQRQSGDVQKFVGHRVHLEFHDEGDGWIVVDEIRQVDPGVNPVEPVSAAALALTEQAIADHDQLAQRTAALVNDAQAAGDEFRQWLIDHQLTTTLADADSSAIREFAEVTVATAQLESALPAPDYVLAMTEGSSEDEHVFIRGSHTNLGEIQPRRMLEAISGSHQPELTSGSGRLALAERMLDPTNPFTSRVIVNRIWHHVFGRGIVQSVDNFGAMGKQPTHPELLDALASEFINDGWSIKRLIRRLMLTHTWRLSSSVNPAYAESDPENLLWYRAGIRRLEGEVIRDEMLAVSGRLDSTMFGPSVPVYLTPFMQGRGRPGRSGPLDGNGRRSIYIEVRRNFLSPMMQAFDTPIPFTTIGRRNASNVPAQALILMNDPFVIDQAQVLARRILKEVPDDANARIRRLYERCFSRLPTEMETQDAVSFLQGQATTLGENVDWQRDERVWADFCHVLFNVKEFVFIR
ncbi:DUF1553 domain-containing protein [bacterium]|nr:DUF1553 domain-containing protein [bacterium]